MTSRQLGGLNVIYYKQVGGEADIILFFDLRITLYFHNYYIELLATNLFNEHLSKCMKTGKFIKLRCKSQSNNEIGLRFIFREN